MNRFSGFAFCAAMAIATAARAHPGHDVTGLSNGLEHVVTSPDHIVGIITIGVLMIATIRIARRRRSNRRRNE